MHWNFLSTSSLNSVLALNIELGCFNQEQYGPPLTVFCSSWHLCSPHRLSCISLSVTNGNVHSNAVGSKGDTMRNPSISWSANQLIWCCRIRKKGLCPDSRLIWLDVQLVEFWWEKQFCPMLIIYLHPQFRFKDRVFKSCSSVLKNCSSRVGSCQRRDNKHLC